MKRYLTVVSKIVVHAALLIPLVIMTTKLISGNLTANPIEAVQIQTGDIGLDLLFVSLACTPIYLFSGFKPILYVRRLSGLYGFLYICLHLVNFLAIDYGFNFTLISEDALFSKRYILVGLIAFLLLIPLVIFSIRSLRLRLGNKGQFIRWFSYAAVILGVLHYIWQTKVDYRLPYIYAGIVLVLLALRLPFISRYLTKHSVRQTTRAAPDNNRQ